MLPIRLMWRLVRLAGCAVKVVLALLAVVSTRHFAAGVEVTRVGCAAVLQLQCWPALVTLASHSPLCRRQPLGGGSAALAGRHGR